MPQRSDIRAPDPSKRQRLVGSRFDSGRRSPCAWLNGYCLLLQLTELFPLGLLSVPLRRLHDQYRDFAAESIAAINAASEDSSAIASSFGMSNWTLEAAASRLTLYGVLHTGPSSGSERSRDLSGLFQPPVSIMFQGTYAEVRLGYSEALAQPNLTPAICVWLCGCSRLASTPRARASGCWSTSRTTLCLPATC